MHKFRTYWRVFWTECTALFLDCVKPLKRVGIGERDQRSRIGKQGNCCAGCHLLFAQRVQVINHAPCAQFR
jgi:hypothetical protein